MAIPENPITRKEHFLAKAAGEGVNTPDPITREEMYLDAIASGSGGGGGDNRFVVTCTPTKSDYSGTMDKTLGEIRSAYNAGKEIWFSVSTHSAPVSSVSTSTYGNEFTAYMIFSADNLMIVLKVYGQNDWRGYDTTIYTLTPMGG